MTTKLLSAKSGLLEIAGRNRGGTDGDGILSIAATRRRAVEILQRNPTVSLLSAWADETLQLLEVSKAEAMQKSKEELKGLIKKKGKNCL